MNKKQFFGIKIKTFFCDYLKVLGKRKQQNIYYII